MRRRTQQETLGHRSHRDDPLYRSRRLLTKGHERLDEKGNTKLLGFLSDLSEKLRDKDMPGEPQQLGRTLRTWHHQIVAWHQAQISNGPTEATNSLIKLVKRVGIGFRRFRDYRLRVLLYAGRPNGDRLASFTPAPPPP